MMSGMGTGWHVMNYGATTERTPITREKLRRMAAYFKPYWREAIAILAVISVVARLGLVPPLLLRELLDHAIPGKDWRLLNLLAIGMIVVPLSTGLLGVLETYLDERLSQGVMLDVRTELFARFAVTAGVRAAGRNAAASARRFHRYPCSMPVGGARRLAPACSIFPIPGRPGCRGRQFLRPASCHRPDKA